jgi:opacity protein-like surface antigen
MIGPKMKRISLRVLLTLAVLGWSGAADGQDIQITPHVAVQGEYTNNVFFDEENEESDILTRVIPGIDWRYRTERLTAEAGARLAAVFYRDEDDLDALEQDYRGDIACHIRPTTRIGAGLGYGRDSLPDRDLAETGLVLGSETRRRYRLNLSGDQVLSDKAGVGVGYSFQEDDYDSDTVSDMTAHSLGIGWTYNLSTWLPELTARMNLGAARYEFDASETDTCQWTLGFSRNLRENFNVLMDVGVRYTEVESRQMVLEPILASEMDPGLPPEADGVIGFRPVEETVTGDSWGGTGELRMTYGFGPGTTGTAGLTHGITAATGRGTNTERTALHLGVRQRMAERFTGLLNLGYFLNRTEGEESDDQELDEASLNLSPGLEIALGDRWTLTARYTYNRIEDRETGRWRQRNLVFFRLRYAHPLFE